MIAGYLDRSPDMPNEWQRGCTIDTQCTVSLFQDGFTNFFWQYDNFGLKLAQIRFYPQ